MLVAALNTLLITVNGVFIADNNGPSISGDVKEY